MCIEEIKDLATECPITSFALSLDEMRLVEGSLYKEAIRYKDSQASFFYSKSILGNPIDEIRLSPGRPCWL